MRKFRKEVKFSGLSPKEGSAHWDAEPDKGHLSRWKCHIPNLFGHLGYWPTPLGMCLAASNRNLCHDAFSQGLANIKGLRVHS